MKKMIVNLNQAVIRNIKKRRDLRIRTSRSYQLLRNKYTTQHLSQLQLILHPAMNWKMKMM